MTNKTIVISLFAMTLLAVTGIGYAAFTSTATANYNGSAGTLNLYFTTASVINTVDNPTNTYGQCNVGVSGGELYITFANGAIGDTCSFTSSIYNGGTLPATSLALSYQIEQTYPGGAITCNALTGAGNCLWYPADQIQGSSGPATGPNDLAAALICSQPYVYGDTPLTAASCSVSSAQLPALGTMTIAAGQSGTYFGTITIIGVAPCPGEFCGQLGATQGMSATQIVSITGSVGSS